MGSKKDVRKRYHFVWQIHYHIVFYSEGKKASLDKEVVEIIRETAIGLQERYVYVII
ncbi:hypothetical protein MYX76_11960 [Desulfobacterota bacterium AH_259_B03_O07]|nr:hypothetical protein [Desulfobacterota bacterium AH_259_B03_O07]